MKKFTSIIFLLLVQLTGCLNLEDDPYVTLDPAVEFQSHIKNSKLNVTATVQANPAFIIPGNIPTVFTYDGEIQMYDEITGTVVSFNSITGNGLSKVVTVSADTAGQTGFIIVVSGTIEAYADKESDGNPSNDLLITTAEFHAEDFIDLIIPEE